MSSKKDKSNNLDNYFMSIAMNLASERIGLTGLNPSVGCVIVKNNKIIGDNFPILTGKHMSQKIFDTEFEWFLNGETNIKRFKDKGEMLKNMNTYKVNPFLDQETDSVEVTINRG